MGVNGAGKSTQMRLIAGHEEPTSGQVVRQGEPRIAYLQQEFDVDLERTVRQELFQAFGEAAEVMNQQKQVEEAMGSERAAEDPDHLDQLIQELGKLQSRFEALHGYELDARIDKLLPTIGFTPEGAELQVKDYSGGWQMRIALGKILLQEPDLLLLDEPTNHLDVETIQWLENYLLEQSPREVAKMRLLNSISSPVLTSLLWGRSATATRVKAHCCGEPNHQNWLVCALQGRLSRRGRNGRHRTEARIGVAWRRTARDAASPSTHPPSRAGRCRCAGAGKPVSCLQAGRSPASPQPNATKSMWRNTAEVG